MSKPVAVQCCSLQHQTLLSPPDTATTEHHFHFGSASSFFLERFLCSSSIAYWTPSNLWGSSLSVISFCLFILCVGCPRQEGWSGLPFPFCQNSPLCPICRGGPCTAWLIASLNYTRLWSTWSCCFLRSWFLFWRLWDCSCFCCLPTDGWG